MNPDKRKLRVLHNLRPVTKDEGAAEPGTAAVGVVASSELLNTLTQLEENQADLSADLTSHKRTYTRTMGQIEGKCSNLSRSLETGERGLSQLQREFALVRDTSDDDHHRIGIAESRLEIVESQLNRTSQGLSLLAKELEAVKRRRLTTTHFLLGVIALAVSLNSIIYTVRSDSINNRIINVEQVLQPYLPQ